MKKQTPERFTPPSPHPSQLRSSALRLISLLGLVSLITAGCSAATPGTTSPQATAPGSTTPAQDTLVIEGLVLTNGTNLVTKAPQPRGLTDDLLVVHLPEGASVYSPGALVEYTIHGAIAESYPPQARAISSRLVTEKSPVLRAPIALSTRIRTHMPQDSVLIDVRTAQEFATGYIPEAINIPLDALTVELPKLVKDPAKTIMVYCRSGNRSATAAARLKELGYLIVLDLGGIVDYKEALVK